MERGWEFLFPVQAQVVNNPFPLQIKQEEHAQNRLYFDVVKPLTVSSVASREVGAEGTEWRVNKVHD